MQQINEPAYGRSVDQLEVAIDTAVSDPQQEIMYIRVMEE
jgi:hypothetical protein